MLVDLKHNKIVSDTVTQGFAESVDTVLLPMLTEKYGDSLTGIQMYEDYIADGFSDGGAWFYPLTLIVNGAPVTEWIKWDISGKNDYKNGIPYSYEGEGKVAFAFAQSVPERFLTALDGRSIYFEDGYIPVNVTAATQDPTFLCGKYSQSFVDAMSRAITAEISKSMSVSGIEGSTLELHLVFAPDTYMEHTSENVTYRRLLLSDKSCAARDFWIKWTRLDSAVAYSVSDTPVKGTVAFELGEDVSQKIREREYRFLVRGNIDKYHMAMGRKNITEWREIIKRAVKRGDLVKVVCDVELAEHAAEVSDKLNELLQGLGATAEPRAEAEIKTASEQSDNDLAKALELARAAVLGQYSDTEQTVVDAVESPEDTSEAEQMEEEALPEATDGDEAVEEVGFITLSELYGETEADSVKSDAEEQPSKEEETEDSDELVLLDESDDDKELLDELKALEPDEDEFDVSLDNNPDNNDNGSVIVTEAPVAVADEPVKEDSFVEFNNSHFDVPANETPATSSPAADNTVAAEPAPVNEPARDISAAQAASASISDIARKEAEEAIRKMHEDRIRAEVEALMRYEVESNARQKAEEEAEKLRREQQALKEENEKLAAMARRAEVERLRAEAEKLAQEEERRLEEAKLRAQIEAQVRAEERERERLAEAAMLQIEAQKRREEEERKKAEAEAHLAKQQARAEELSRLEAERIAEAARINHEIEELRREKLAVEARVAAASGIPIVTQQPQPEPVHAEEPAPVEEPITPEPEYTYVSRHARLLFRRPVDPNITKNIHEIIKKTMVERGKENVYIRIKADIPDANTVDLDFIQIPEEEGELLVAIIQALGDSGMGISKAILN